MSTAHEEHGVVLARYQTLDFQTGSTMLDQFHAAYLGIAFPFTIPVAVGSYDVKGQERWRRVLTEGFEASQVSLFDITRSLPQRIEGQYRRHWAFVPGVWNLYFREQVNTGVSLSTQTHGAASNPCDGVEQDAALAAAEIYEKLHTGPYETQTGQRRKIARDVSKLLYAEELTQQQRRIFADFSFRTRSIPGTQGIRTKIYHTRFWGQVVYGNGIFMTISPGERPNYLAITPSRYRGQDPFILCSDTLAERAWIGPDAPCLTPLSDDVFEIKRPWLRPPQTNPSKGPACVRERLPGTSKGRPGNVTWITDVPFLCGFD